MSFTEKDKAQLKDEKRDPRRILAGCTLHGYYGPSIVAITKPAHGCKECWMVWWLHELLKYPASERDEAMEMAFESITKCNEAVENGTWNFTPFDRPEITIEKDAI
jgi:hypothetical protein